MKQCHVCGDSLPSDYPSPACQDCIGFLTTSPEDYDNTVTEFDSVEDWVQQEINEALGLD